MDQWLEEIRAALPELVVYQQEPMKKHTTFRVGGSADLYVCPKKQELPVILGLAKKKGLAVTVIGNGSNLLVGDKGIRGLVIEVGAQMNAVEVQGNILRAQAGALLSQVAAKAAVAGLGGMEFAAGIPGSMGGAVTMNAGAYGGELCQVVRAVRVLEPDGRVEEVPAEDCRFRYRHSAFSEGGRLVLSARLELAWGEAEAIRTQMSELMARRREKQPLEYPSAGSVFKRPQGHYAAALIDQCGLKGLTIGGAQVSAKHAGFIVNIGMATCRDVLDLIGVVRDCVYRVTGVELEPEVKYLK